MKNRGFTLIEIIVSVSIFTVVMMVVIGSLLSMNDSSRKAQALRTVIDNLNFAVEDMSRKIRTGDSFHCYDNSVSFSLVQTPLDCSDNKVGGHAISFRTQEGQLVIYMFDPKANGEGAGGIKVQEQVNGLNGPELAITAPEVNIKEMTFRVIGANNPIKTQPMVMLNIYGSVDLQKEKLKTDFNIQTAISSRTI